MRLFAVTISSQNSMLSRNFQNRSHLFPGSTTVKFNTAGHVTYAMDCLDCHNWLCNSAKFSTCSIIIILRPARTNAFLLASNCKIAVTWCSRHQNERSGPGGLSHWASLKTDWDVSNNFCISKTSHALLEFIGNTTWAPKENPSIKILLNWINCCANPAHASNSSTTGDISKSSCPKSRRFVGNSTISLGL